jgi:3-isopropylmalate/(R)-2-methylmalate dehydratase small subunit
VKAFRRVTARAAVLDRTDVDTDQIIPKQFLKRIELHRPEFEGARILLAAANFGCGSSREHAAWALQEYGFDVVIAPSFGDIFRSNAQKVGLVPVVLEHDEVLGLMDACAGGAELTVDLAALEIVDPSGRVVPFQFNAFARECILEGVDDVALTLRREADIAAFERATSPRVDTLALRP